MLSKEMANPIQQLTLRRELADAAAARRRRKSEVDGDDDALFMSACPGPVRLLKDLARLLWMYVTFFGFLTGGGLVSADDTHTQVASGPFGLPNSRFTQLF